MANKLYEESSISAIANAIRAKNGSSNTYTVAQMANAITDIPSGGSSWEFPANASLGNSTFTTFPEDFIFAKRTTCYQLFRLCSNMTTPPSPSQLDTSDVTNMQEMFGYCSKLTQIPLYDTSKVTTMKQMFNNCSKLTTIPQLNMDKVTNADSMFSGCTALVIAPSLDLGNVSSPGGMFNGCTNLETVPIYDFSKATGLANMFLNCPKLATQTQSLKNILQSIINGTSITVAASKKLSVIFGTNTTGKANINACAALPEWQTLLAAGWITGIS